MLGLRFGIAGVLLLGALVAGRRPLLPAPGERVRAGLLGGIGYAIESTCFFLGLAHGTVAAVVLLFYVYPAVVMLLEVPLLGTRPRGRSLAALTLSVAGAAVIAIGGGEVHISPLGIVLSLGSAAAFALYLLASERLVTRTDALTTAAWVAVGASVSLLAGALVRGAVRMPSGYWWDMAGYALATAVAFTCMFAALRRLGSSRTAVIMTLEAVFGIVLAAVFLGESIGPLQVVGGLAVLGGAAMIALSPAAPTRPKASTQPRW